MNTLPTDIPVKIKEEEELSGRHPVVIIGPNGSGKTRYGVKLSEWNNADLIGALRQIALNPNLTVYSMQQSKTHLTNSLRNRRSQPWQLSTEIEHLFAKLLVEDYTSASRFRDAYMKGESATPDQTKIMKISSLWNRLFPGREISFTDNSPKVKSRHISEETEYPAQQMSDGERVALYLAGRVLDSESAIIIVDEPEVHFHSRLAVLFWDELERLRPDCRFVYITHDLPFALSRQSAEFVVLRTLTSPEPVSLDEGVPAELAESLLAAASFSIHASRIVFCEGTRGKSIDEALYSAWFSDLDSAVIPVGQSSEVMKCTTAFTRQELFAGVEAIGIIDRDYWPEHYLSSLHDNIHVLPVHEAENLLCLEAVFCSVARHLSIPVEEAKSRYNGFLEDARKIFRGGALNKQISERFRARCEHEVQVVLCKLEVNDVLETVRANHVEALKPEHWQTDPDVLFSEERQFLEDALIATEKEFLQVFPGKSFWKRAAKELGLEAEAYLNLVCSALRGDPEMKSSPLGPELEGCLKSYLPPRLHRDAI